MATTVTQTREVESFQAITLHGIGTVEFSQAPEISVVVHAEPDALELISTTVTGNTLHIDTKLISTKFVALKHPPIYKISAPDLSAIDLRGAGRALTADLTTDHLAVSVDGAGDVRLTNLAVQACRIEIAGAGNVSASGTTADLEVAITGTGNFSGGQLGGETGRVNIAGAGRAKVNIARELRVDIGGVGTVSYLGDPVLQSKVHGLGRVKKA